MLVLAGLWKLWTWKTSDTLKKKTSKQGNCMAWPTHEYHFQSTFCSPLVLRFGTIMLVLAGLWVVLAGLWKLWTWKTSDTLKKKNTKQGNCMAWPTHEYHFQSTFCSPLMSNVAFKTTIETKGFGHVLVSSRP